MVGIGCQPTWNETAKPPTMRDLTRGPLKADNRSLKSWYIPGLPAGVNADGLVHALFVACAAFLFNPHTEPHFKRCFERCLHSAHHRSRITNDNSRSLMALPKL